MADAHEQGFLRFVAPDRRARLAIVLESRKGAHKLRRGLDHFADLDPRFAERLNGRASLRPNIEARLRALGAPNECYVVSEDASLDGLSLPLSDALEATVGWAYGTFLSCVPGRLAYFENEDGRWILRRDPVAPA